MAKQQGFKAAVVALAVAGALAACGGGGGGGGGSGNDGGGGGGSGQAAGTTIAGTVVKGPVGNATVCLYALDGNGVAATQPTGNCESTSANGSYTLRIDATSGHFLVVASGGTYTNEATGTANVPLSDPLKAIVSANGGSVVATLTPLTSIAVNYLANVSGGTLDERHAAAVAEVLDQFRLGGVDINAAPDVSAATADAYGRVLRAIAAYLGGSGESGALAALLGWDEARLAQLQGAIASAYAGANAGAPVPAFAFSNRQIIIGNGGGNDNGGGGTVTPGLYTLRVSTTVAGIAPVVIELANVPKPASQDEFCADDLVRQQMANSAGSWTMNSCTFSGNNGRIAATLAPAGAPMSVSYTIDYLYIAQ